jgi:hypothetical protein
MSWLTDTQAQGKTMQHTDGTKGIVLDVIGDIANIQWADGTLSTEHENYLVYV